MKFRKIIKKNIIEEVIEKTGRLRIPGHLSIRPILIYEGKIEKAIISEGYFFNIINFGQFLEKP